MSRLRELRQANMSHKIKIASRNISAVEIGDRRPWPNFKRKVATALNLPESEIFEEKGEVDGNR